MKTIKHSILWGLLLLCNSCKDDKIKTDPKPDGTTPVVNARLPVFEDGGTIEPLGTVLKLSNTIKENGGAAITQHGYAWSDTKTEPLVADNKVDLGKTDGPFPLKISAELKDLKKGVKYYVRPFAINSVGTKYGSVQSYVIAEGTEPPVVKNLDPANITTATFTLKGRIEKTGNKPIVGYGFQYSEKELIPANSLSFLTKTVGNSLPANTAVPFVFEADISDLRENTTYYTRAYISIQTENTVPAKYETFYDETVKIVKTLQNQGALGTWTNITSDYNTAQLGFFNVWYNGLHYEFSRYGSIQTYNPVTKSATVNAGPGFPGEGSINTLVQYKNSKVYILMGYTDTKKISKQVWEYDMDTKKWTQKADFPGLPRVDAVAVAGGTSKLFIGGGNEYTVTKPGYATTLKDWWEYDPIADKWTQKADIPYPLYDLKGFENQINEVVVGMGMSFAVSGNVFSLWHKYNPFTNVWSRLDNLPEAHQKSSPVAWTQRFKSTNYILVLNATGTKYNMWGFSASNKWIKMAEFPVAPDFNLGLWPTEQNGRIVLFNISSNSATWVYEFKP